MLVVSDCNRLIRTISENWFRRAVPCRFWPHAEKKLIDYMRFFWRISMAEGEADGEFSGSVSSWPVIAYSGENNNRAIAN